MNEKDEAYDEFMRELREYRESLAKLPPKKTNPGSVTIICQIEEGEVNALCDVGSSVNVMPLFLAEKLKLTKPTTGTEHELVTKASLNCYQFQHMIKWLTS
jgi:hypothetical protein